jgi:glycosyltransferase involved in cell wall biosynthesis
MNPEFSVIIPTLDNFRDIEEIIPSISAQTLLPKEIVVVDSSASNKIQAGIDKIESKVPVIYLRVGRAYRFDRLFRYVCSLPFLLKYKNKFPPGRAFPYEATNVGSSIARYEWLAFLDATTVPINTWLEDYWGFINSQDCDVVFGRTKYLANSSFQKILRASTYGRLGHETAPGSIMKRDEFLSGFKIREGVRSGGDLEWKIKIKNSLTYHLPKKNYLQYPNLPTSLFPTLKKFFTYQIYSSFVAIQNNIKDVYLVFSLIFGLILVPKWNSIVGWESPFFFPHITKVFFISILLVFLISLIINRGVLRWVSDHSFLVTGIKIAIFIIVSYCVYKWNFVAANWVEDSIWYIPHITKIFVCSVLLASFTYRGIYFPIKNNIQLSYLFPFRWILVGLLGILLDIIKSPGYLLGAVLASFIRSSDRAS